MSAQAGGGWGLKDNEAIQRDGGEGGSTAASNRAGKRSSKANSLVQSDPRLAGPVGRRAIRYGWGQSNAGQQILAKQKLGGRHDTRSY